MVEQKVFGMDGSMDNFVGCISDSYKLFRSKSCSDIMKYSKAS